MHVVEIFESIQGEGYHMGKWVTFIRLAGCNLNCTFCDEKSKYSKAKDISIVEIVQQIHTDMVVITGGEPTLNPYLSDLCKELHSKQKYIAIETNGTNNIEYDMVDWVTCSPKEESNFKVPDTGFNELKVVVDKTVMEHPHILTELMQYAGEPIWLQPCDGPYIKKSMEYILDFLKKDTTNSFRAGIQLHKYYGAV